MPQKKIRYASCGICHIYHKEGSKIYEKHKKRCGQLKETSPYSQYRGAGV